MKKELDKLFIITMYLISIVFIILLIISNKQEFSEVENRYLTKFSLNNLEEYLKDYFPYRTSFIKLNNKLKLMTGSSFINNVYIANNNYLIPAFIDNDKKDYIIDVVNNYAYKNNNVTVMFIPDSITINEDLLRYHLNNNETKDIDYLYKNINTNSVNIINELKESNKSNDMYYKTDHHWTTHGAYVAYKKYMESINIKPFNKEDFHIRKVSDNFLGTSSSLVYGIAKKEDIYIYDRDTNLTVNYVYENKVTSSLYNFDYLNKKDKYAMFLDNNHALIEITNNDIMDESSILIIKNSYGNCFVPFIVNHFHKTYVIDLRYFKDNVSDYVSNNNIERTLIIYNIINLYSDMSLVKLK